MYLQKLTKRNDSKLNIRKKSTDNSHMYCINITARECLISRILLSCGKLFATAILFHKPRAYGPSVTYMAVQNFKQLPNLSVYYTKKIQRGLFFNLTKVHNAHIKIHTRIIALQEIEFYHESYFIKLYTIGFIAVLNLRS